MLNTGKKNCALRDKKINILILVLSENKILKETKNHNPPFKLNGWSLRMKNNKSFILISFCQTVKTGFLCWTYKSLCKYLYPLTL